MVGVTAILVTVLTLNLLWERQEQGQQALHQNSLGDRVPI